MKPKTIHATSVVKDSGVLIVGDSGLGKSDLALRLIDSGATLISDDITICKKADDSIFLFPPYNKRIVRVRGRYNDCTIC